MFCKVANTVIVNYRSVTIYLANWQDLWYYILRVIGYMWHIH